MKNINRNPTASGSVPFASELKQLVGILGEAQFAILYGSLVTGAVRAESDVDLAVMFPAPLDSNMLIRLVGEVSALFGRPVDLVDLHKVGPILKMQILRNGRPVVVNDIGAFEDFRMYTPNEYSDFKICRRPAEEALKTWRPS